MTSLVEYEKFVYDIMSPASMATRKSQLNTAAIGLFAESGEFLDHIKKVLYHGAELEPRKTDMLKELGDIVFYATFSAVVVVKEPLETLLQSPDDFKINDLDDFLILAEYVGDYAKWTRHSSEKIPPSILPSLLRLIFQCITVAAEYLGSTFQEVLEGNVEKLSSRYKEKKFSVEEFKAKEALKTNG